jgi:hypothetical protein
MNSNPKRAEPPSNPKHLLDGFTDVPDLHQAFPLDSIEAALGARTLYRPIGSLMMLSEFGEFKGWPDGF